MRRQTARKHLLILGKEGQEATTYRKESGEEMQWKMVTAQREDPIFVFNERPNGVGDQNEGKKRKPNKALGRMAMTYSNELGWTGKAWVQRVDIGSARQEQLKTWARRKTQVSEKLKKKVKARLKGRAQYHCRS